MVKLTAQLADRFTAHYEKIGRYRGGLQWLSPAARVSLQSRRLPGRRL